MPSLEQEGRCAASGQAGFEHMENLKLISAATVRDLCGGVSDMSLHRWTRAPDLGFPQPIYICGRRYWREADLTAWLEAQASKAGA